MIYSTSFFVLPCEGEMLYDYKSMKITNDTK